MPAVALFICECLVLNAWRCRQRGTCHTQLVGSATGASPQSSVGLQALPVFMLYPHTVDQSSGDSNSNPISSNRPLAKQLDASFSPLWTGKARARPWPGCLELVPHQTPRVPNKEHVVQQLQAAQLTALRQLETFNEQSLVFASKITYKTIN